MSADGLRASSTPRGIHLLAGIGLLLGASLNSPAWGRGKDCAFRTGTSPILAFGVLDPSAARAVQQRATAVRNEDLEAGDCAPGAQMRIQVDGGLHDAGGRLRMRHAIRPDAFLPYAVQVDPVMRQGPGKQRYIGFALAGRLEAADIAAARGGTYHDTLRISVFP